MVRYILKHLYRTGPDGLCGNDDCGQMSAWYVFSAMGFYPVCPGTPYYVIGSPSLDRVKIHLDNGKIFEIIAKNYSPENIYISQVFLNGKELNRLWITHDEIMKGGKMVFEMSKTPNVSKKFEPIPSN